MSATQARGRRTSLAWAAAAMLAAACTGGMRAASGATCDVIPGVSAPNTPALVFATSDDSNDRRWTVSQPYWIAVGAIAYDPANDIDLGIYGYNSNLNPPPCFTPLYGASGRGAGQTDFVVGDFNHNPYATYVNTVTCYSGQCDGQARGLQVWRDGDLFYVDDPPHVLTFPTQPDRIVKIWDIYLVQGTTYHFRFEPSGDTQPKLLLFRNPGGGVFWTGRYGAEFETANCVTNYTAPGTGYYGMVVVNDRYSTNPIAITLAVTTGPACACPGIVAHDTPQIVPPGATQADYEVAATSGLMLAVGVRSPSDWDLYEGQTAPGPDVGCIALQTASSVLVPPKADVIAGDFTHTFTYPDTFGIRASRSSGVDGATLEVAEAPWQLWANAPSQVGTMTADDVVKTWNVWMDQGVTYNLRFFPGGANVSLLLFDNPPQSASLWLGRSSAVLETKVSTTFTAPVTGYYGFVMVKDDAPIGNYDFGFGYCTPPRALTSKQVVTDFDPTFPPQFEPYFSIDQEAANWTASCIYGPGGDWDIAQYEQAGGSSWPECLAAAGALSNGVVGVDVIVGDFHYNAAGKHYIHSYPSFVNQIQPSGYTEWDAGSGALQVNPAQPVNVNLPGNEYGDRIWCYEAYLGGGLPYTLSFTHSGAADPHVLVFENPGAAPYWAPRSAAILSATSSTAFTPATTGWHGIVVVNDNDNPGSFTLSVLSSVLAADVAPTPAHDELSAVAPNPARGPLRIDYALSHPAQVSFEVLDLAGRLVLRIPASATGAGRWSQVWDGRGSSGQPLAGGVYLLRMSADGRTVATRKVMRLN